jgi:hypothetical protein
MRMGEYKIEKRRENMEDRSEEQEGRRMEGRV